MRLLLSGPRACTINHHRFVMNRKWTDNDVSQCLISIVCHVHWLGQTHQLTKESVHYESVIFIVQAPGFEPLISGSVFQPAATVLPPLANVLLFIFQLILKFWMRGPTKGSDNPKKLDGRVVLITGNIRVSPNDWLYSIQGQGMVPRLSV